MLCLFHVKKNIEGACLKHNIKDQDKKLFMQGWIGVLESKNSIDFENAWLAIRQNWQNYPNMIGYIQKNWMPLHFEFAHARTNRVLHRGNRTTNRAEGAHAQLKKHLTNSTGSFATVWKGMDALLGHQVTQIQTEFQKSLQSTKHGHNDALLREIRGRASQYALDLNVVEIDC